MSDLDANKVLEYIVIKTRQPVRMYPTSLICDVVYLLPFMDAKYYIRFLINNIRIIDHEHGYSNIDYFNSYNFMKPSAHKVARARTNIFSDGLVRQYIYIYIYVYIYI